MKPKKEFDYDKVAEHAAKLHELAGLIRQGTKKVTQSAIVIGGAFLAAKVSLEHGAFRKWCEAATTYSFRSAELYMNLAGLFHRLDEEDGQYLCELPLTAALILASPSVDEDTVKDILSRVRNRERVKVKHVKEAVSRSKSDAEDAARALSRAMGDMVKHALNANQRQWLFEFLRADPRLHGRLFVERLLTVLPEEEANDDYANTLAIRKMIAA